VFKAKKSFGQHFLHREDIAERIALTVPTNAQILEVGPGTGMLTKHLLKRTTNFKAVEADKDMITYLNIHYPQIKDSIIAKDFMKLKLNEIFEGQFMLIGNFPYNISSQILIKMIEHKEQIPDMVGMFQKEVAERVIAPPGSKVYGVISVLCQAYYEGAYLFTVDKSCFSPPPKVQSAVIHLTRKENQELGCDHQTFRQVVKQSFGQRRKMLRNTLKGLLHDDLLTDPFYTQRPESLSVAQFVEIANQVSK
jgi:16S rRNA (adenine1518-N6/adenine1519-N6)-dimethyltransferase